MAKPKVKQVRSIATEDNPEPVWEVIVDYGGGEEVVKEGFHGRQEVLIQEISWVFGKTPTRDAKSLTRRAATEEPELAR